MIVCLQSGRANYYVDNVSRLPGILQLESDTLPTVDSRYLEVQGTL